MTLADPAITRLSTTQMLEEYSRLFEEAVGLIPFLVSPQDARSNESAIVPDVQELRFKVAIMDGDLLTPWCKIQAAAESGELKATLARALPEVEIATGKSGKISLEGCDWCICPAAPALPELGASDDFSSAADASIDADNLIVENNDKKQPYLAPLLIILFLLLFAVIVYLLWKKKQEAVAHAEVKTTSQFTINPAHSLGGMAAGGATYDMVADTVAAAGGGSSARDGMANPQYAEVPESDGGRSVLANSTYSSNVVPTNSSYNAVVPNTMYDSAGPALGAVDPPLSRTAQNDTYEMMLDDGDVDC